MSTPDRLNVKPPLARNSSLASVGHPIRQSSGRGYVVHELPMRGDRWRVATLYRGGPSTCVYVGGRTRQFVGR